MNRVLSWARPAKNFFKTDFSSNASNCNESTWIYKRSCDPVITYKLQLKTTKTFFDLSCCGFINKFQSYISNIENQLNYPESDLLWKVLDYENNF